MKDKEFVEWLKSKSPSEAFKIRDFLMKNMGQFGIATFTASLSARVFRKGGSMEDLGIVSIHAVTDAFVAQLVDTLQSSEATFSNYKYHDSGTGDTAEDAGDTTLETPCGEARDVGSQIEGATTNIYKSVGTSTYAGTFAITEHAVFNASANGTMLDRSVITVVNVETGDRIEWTYQLTCTAGG